MIEGGGVLKLLKNYFHSECVYRCLVRARDHEF